MFRVDTKITDYFKPFVPMEEAQQKRRDEAWPIVADWVTEGDLYYFFLLRCVNTSLAAWARTVLPLLPRYADICLCSSRWSLTAEEFELLSWVTVTRRKPWRRFALNFTYWFYVPVVALLRNSTCVVWDLTHFPLSHIQHVACWLVPEVRAWVLVCRDAEQQARVWPNVLQATWRDVTFQRWIVPHTLLLQIKATVVRLHNCLVAYTYEPGTPRTNAVCAVSIHNPGQGLQQLAWPYSVTRVFIQWDQGRDHRMVLPSILRVHQLTVKGALLELQPRLQHLLSVCRVATLTMVLTDFTLNTQNSFLLEQLLAYLYLEYDKNTCYVLVLSDYTVEQIAFWQQAQQIWPFPRMTVTRSCPRLALKPESTHWVFQ